jgi:hypothetical protein
MRTLTTVLVATALAVSLAIGGTNAKDFRVSEIRPIGQVKCNFHNQDSALLATKPCSDFKPPAKVAVGEPFSAEGLHRVIRFIVANQAEEGYELPNWSIKKGEYFCLAAETVDDLGAGQPHRIWLFIARCIPAL